MGPGEPCTVPLLSVYFLTQLLLTHLIYIFKLLFLTLEFLLAHSFILIFNIKIVNTLSQHFLLHFRPF